MVPIRTGAISFMCSFSMGGAMSGFSLKSILKKILPIVGFAFVLFIGMNIGSTYGIGVDQYPEQEILFMNLRPYAEILFGQDSKYTEILGESDICTDIERDHGAAPMYIAAPFAISGRIRNNPQLWIKVYRYCIFFIFWLGLIALYKLVKKLTGSSFWGAVSVGMMWLNPRFFAESTYNNMDTVAAACVLLSLYFGYVMYSGKDNDFVSPIFLGFCSALSANVRLTGILIFGLVGVFYITRIFIWEKWNKRLFFRGIVAIISFCLFSYMITPAMWHGNIWSFIKYVFAESAYHSRWSNYILAAGRLFHTDLNPIRWWYALAYIAVTIPVAFLIMIVMGMVMFVVKLLKCKDANSLFLLIPFLFCMVILVVAAISGTSLYNGWRHLYSLYGCLIVIGVCASEYICSILSNIEMLSMLQYVVYLLILVQMVSCVSFIAKNHPFEFAYYNIFAGKNVEERWDGDWWGISSKAILEMADEQLGGCTISNAETWYLVLTLQYCDEQVIQNVEVTGFPDSEYIALNRMYVEYYLRSESENWVEVNQEIVEFYKELLSTDPVYEIKCGNCILWSVYAAPR